MPPYVAKRKEGIHFETQNKNKVEIVTCVTHYASY